MKTTRRETPRNLKRSLSLGLTVALISSIGFAVPAAGNEAPIDIYDADAVLDLIAPEIQSEVGGTDRYERINLNISPTGRSGDTSLKVKLQANEVNPSSNFSRTPDTVVHVPFAVEEVATSDTESIWSTDSKDAALYLSEVVTGVRFLTVLGSSDASSTYEYQIDVPGGTTAETTSEGLLISDSTGNRLGAVVTPWVRDSSGNSVPATYSWNDGTLTQSINTENLDSSAYPIVAQSGWSYAYYWEIPNKTVAQNRANLLNCFNCYFPVPGAPATFPSYGQHLPLYIYTIPPFTANFNCTMDTVGWQNGGTARTQYFSYRFMAAAGHVDGLGSSITFNINPMWQQGAPVSQTYSGLFIDAWIMNSNPLGVPRAVYEAGAVINWNNFANNLNNA